jgi:RimJ/RimL family protein N-acetyltransferase
MYLWAMYLERSSDSPETSLGRVSRESIPSTMVVHMLLPSFMSSLEIIRRMPGAVFLRGNSVTLRTIEEEDLEFLRDAINDPEVREGLIMARPINAEQEREYFEERVSSEDGVNLAICVDEEIVGTVGLSDVDQRAGNCEIGVWVAPEFHGRGYGTEASRLLTQYAFDELRMHRVLARVLATNEASARIWEKLGFEEEGVHRDEAFTDGEYVDIRYFSVLEDEWEA